MARTALDCALTGAIGILTGFAVFILTWEEQSSVAQFLGILLLVAIFAAVFEYVRDVIEGSEHRVSVPQMVIRLFLLAIFELFITAIHTAASFNKTQLAEVGTAVLGPTLAAQTSAVVNLTLMAVLWIVIGAAVGASLAFAIRSVEDKRLRGLGAGAIGLAAGALGAPCAVLCYVIVTRVVAELRWMFSRPDEWAQNVHNLNERVDWNAWLWPVKAGSGLVLWIYSWFHGTLGLIIACVALTVIVGIALAAVSESKDDERPYYLWWTVAAPVAIFGAPLVGPSIFDDLRRVGQLLLLVGVVWGLPGLLIGLAVPYLREPSHDRKTWAGVAWLAAAFLIAFAYLVQSAWVAIFAAILSAAAIAFWRNSSVEEYWPLLALSIATIVLGATKITVAANFLNIQDISRILLDQPLAKVAPLERKDPFDVLRGSPLFAPLNPASAWLWATPLPSQSAATWRRNVAEEDSKVEKLLSDAGILAGQLQARSRDNESMSAKLAELRVRDLPKVAEDAENTRTAIDGTTKAEARLDEENRALKNLETQQPAFSFSMPFGGLDVERYRIDKDAASLSDTKQRLQTSIAAAQSELTALEGTLQRLKDELAQRFELCVTGSFGFWVTLGLLAGWARRRNRLAEG
ncbi:MAG TPA: hypothetical protein VN603_02865 [Candidatus Acidoferrales bacterium]|nr:hypothetical protein [Candidatus Acidoferrales bacterium]